MKNFTFILCASLLLSITFSCAKDDDIADTVTDKSIEEVDEFYFRLVEDDIMNNIECASYVKPEGYEWAKNNAYQNQERIGTYWAANVRGISEFFTEDVLAGTVEFSMTEMDSHLKRSGLTVLIAGSNTKSIICNGNDGFIDDIFNADNNKYFPKSLLNNESLDSLRTNLNLALVNISYQLFSIGNQTEVLYKSFGFTNNSELYAQPESSYFTIDSVTNKIHKVEARSYEDVILFDYDYIVEGKGKVRVFNETNPENDYKDLEFTFEIPSKTLLTNDFFCN